VTRSLDVRLSRLERSNQPVDAIARIVFGDDRPPPGEGPIIRINWAPAATPRWPTKDKRIEATAQHAATALGELE
jgi:hypothetical protein